MSRVWAWPWLRPRLTETRRRPLGRWFESLSPWETETCCVHVSDDDDDFIMWKKTQRTFCWLQKDDDIFFRQQLKRSQHVGCRCSATSGPTGKRYSLLCILWLLCTKRFWIMCNMLRWAARVHHSDKHEAAKEPSWFHREVFNNTSCLRCLLVDRVKVLRLIVSLWAVQVNGQPHRNRLVLLACFVETFC